jgi:hypothetical protein
MSRLHLRVIRLKPTFGRIHFVFQPVLIEATADMGVSVYLDLDLPLQETPESESSLHN